MTEKSICRASSGTRNTERVEKLKPCWQEKEVIGMNNSGLSDHLEGWEHFSMFKSTFRHLHLQFDSKGSWRLGDSKNGWRFVDVIFLPQ